ncbi:restriction endonuclease subunit S [Thermoactinomyces intermedius]|nr:restriction endonuclease subunit S [Thermoactinomyces intermedius]MBA4835678.1 restriction endonuclease subunit S [Thermoactinomyces intermedius]
MIEWKSFLLGDVIEYANGSSFPNRFQGLKQKKYDFYKVSDMNNPKNFMYMVEAENTVDDEIVEKLKAKVHPKDTVIFPKVGAALLTNKRRILSKPSLFDNNIMGIKPKKELLPLYLYYFMLTIDFAKYVQSGAVPSINKTIIDNIPINLPSLPEQRKIAAILSSVDEAIEKTETIIEQTEKVKKGLMQQLLTKGIGHTKFKKTEIGEIPEKWEVKKIGEIASVEYGISESVSSNTDPSIGIPILTGANITLDGTLDLSKLVYIEKKQQERFQLKKGDLLFNWRSGSQHHVGKTAIFNLDGDYTYASFILRIRLNEDSHNEFYYYLLNYLKSIDYFIKNTSMQVNFKLNASSFKELLVVKPTLEEQIRISKIISSVDKKIQKEKNRLNQLQTIKQGLMQVLLTGKVRVKVDDEVVSS